MTQRAQKLKKFKISLKSETTIKIKFALFRGGGPGQGGGAGRKIVQNAIFLMGNVMTIKY